MGRVYGVQDDDDKLSGWMSEDDTDEAPTGETAVKESIIRAADPPGADGRIQSGGKWDGAHYTAPVGDEFYQPYDTSTDVGMLQSAAFLAHTQLLAWRVALDSVAPFYPAEDVAVGRDFLTFAHRGVRGVMLSTYWTVAERVKFAEEMASGALDVTSPAQFFELIEEAREEDPDADPPSGIAAPTQRVVWVTPTGAVRFNLAQAVEETVEVETNMVAEVTDYTVYTSGGWIDDITG